jgi:hypothetical protein
MSLVTGTSDYIACDGHGCHHTLPIPTTREKADGWQRHDLVHNERHYTLHTCPTCPEEPVRARLEALRR